MKNENYKFKYCESLQDGNVDLLLRNNVFYARIAKGDTERGYVFKTLKTSKIEDARFKALQVFAEIDHKKRNGIPLVSVSFEKVINDYIAMREAQFKRGNYVRGKENADGQQTSAYNLRQMKRKAKFWIEYAGKRSVCSIKDRHLEDYIEWRRDYYHRMSDAERPRNHALNPADKTLQDESIFALTVLKWAKKQNYRGNQPDAKYYFKASRCKTRPNFTPADFEKLMQTLDKRVAEARPHERYMRETLRDFVLVARATGARVGELYGLRETDLTRFVDERERENFRLAVDGKTGQRELVMRAAYAHVIDRVLARNKAMQAEWDRSAGKASNRKTAIYGNWLFRMKDGSKITGLVDQFAAALEAGGIKKNARGEDYSLYSLRHTYAVEKIRSGLNVFDASRNMGCSIAIIQSYYGKHAVPSVLATALGD